ncbi:MAG: DUF3343 domain-containing protein [Actinobacteria bacterium]|nr:MAG: DUF3343 domain-containing protein [Actinomycetota bacterium]
MYLFLFESTHHQLSAEKVLKRNKIRPKVVPVPKRYSTGCNIALEASDKDYNRIEELINKAQLDYKVVEIKND